MNIELQLGGVCILLLLVYFYKRQGSLGLYMGKLFMRVLSVSFICLVLDILSVILIVYQEQFPVWLVEGECKAYLITLVLTGYIALIYANADVHNLARADTFSYVLMAIVTGMCILIYALPIETYYDGQRVVYTYGMACIASYVAALILIAMIFVMLITQGKKMNPKRRGAILLWMCIWVLAAALQFLNNSLLLVGFASALGMVILFFELENPEIYIDRSTGFFNSYALGEYLKQRYKTGTECYGIMISLEDMDDKNISLMKMEAAMAEVSQFVRQLPDTLVFKTDNREFSLVFDDYRALETTKNVILERFQHRWAKNTEKTPDESPVYLQPRYLIIPSVLMANSADELLGLLKYFRMRFTDITETDILTLDDRKLAQKRDRDNMVEIVRQAIKENRVEVFYQPIYSVAEKKFVSAEALVRIRRANGSVIPPGLFIPIAEETGLIETIGEIVFDKTCRFIKENEIEKYGIQYIEVNLSVVQCENELLAETFINIMKKYDIAPWQINLEITESAAIARKDVLLENMRTLIEYGVKFSLDDFGNGQSNLNYIVDMPIHIVKFDRDMTQAYFETPRASFVVQAVTNMIHEMHLKVVSEGVETAEQLAVLELLGVDYIQGYYFSKPIEADEFLDFVIEKNRGGNAEL